MHLQILNYEFDFIYETNSYIEELNNENLQIGLKMNRKEVMFNNYDQIEQSVFQVRAQETINEYVYYGKLTHRNSSL